MNLELQRRYFSGYTEGLFMLNEVILCHSIELPWKGNQKNISCIPEGEYQIQFRKSNRFRNHLIINGVPGRSWILIHPANDARKELRGCIAPVMKIIGFGIGSYSRLALDLILLNLNQQAQQKHYLTITSKQ